MIDRHVLGAVPPQHNVISRTRTAHGIRPGHVERQRFTNLNGLFFRCNQTSWIGCHRGIPSQQAHLIIQAIPLSNVISDSMQALHRYGHVAYNYNA